VNDSQPDLIQAGISANRSNSGSDLQAVRHLALGSLRGIIAGLSVVFAILPSVIPFPPTSPLLPGIRLLLLLVLLLSVLPGKPAGPGRYFFIAISFLAIGLINHAAPAWVPLAWGIQLGAIALFSVFLGSYLSFIILLLSIVLGAGLDWYVMEALPLNLDFFLTPIETGWLAGWISYLLVGSGLCFGAHWTLKRFTNRISDQNSALEDSRLLVSDLKEKVSDQAAELGRRVIQIQTATEISRAIAGIRDETELLQKVVDLVKDRFQLYYAGVFLTDQPAEYAALKAGSGEAGNRMVREEHRLAVGGSSMIGWCIAMRKPRISFDVGQEAVWFANPHLPKTRSELALPLLVHDNVLGALTIQSTEANAFDLTDVSILTGIADNLAVALFNARLFRQIQTNLDEISYLHQQYLADAWMDTIEETGVIGYTYQSEYLAADKEIQSQIHIPLTLRNQVIGRVILGGERESFSPEELAFIDAVITQTALALENTRLLTKLRRQLQRERQVNEIYSKLLSKPEIDEIIKTAATEIGQALNVPEVQISLHGNHQYHYRTPGLPSQTDVIPASTGTQEVDGSQETSSSTESPERNILAMPILLRGDPIGAVDLITPTPDHHWSEDELYIVQKTVSHLALILENARLLDNTLRRMERERKVVEITGKIRASSDPQAMLQTALDELRKNFDPPPHVPPTTS
jgi:GAF domain-containing protein